VKLFASAISVWAAFALSGCQTSSGVAAEYRDALETKNFKEAKQTAIIFLVDGLSVSALQRGLKTGAVTHIAGYFPVASGGFKLGRASFPSLTYPNLTSILTGETIAVHPIRGNRIPFEDDGELNFETFTSWRVLGRLVRNRTIFHSLSDRNESSVSFSYPFPRGSTAHQEKNFDAGLSYLEEDFAAVDTATIRSLENLLHEEKWPRFIFVHLIGVDAIEHHLGPDQPAVVEYLSSLDAQLGPVFELLRSRRSKVQALLTADHGFQKTDFKVPLKDVLAKISPKVKLIEDNRIASLRTGTMTESNRRALAENLLHVPHVSMTILKTDEALELFLAGGKKARIEFAPAPCAGGFAARFRWQAAATDGPYRCLEDFDRVSSFKDDSFVVSSLAEYFKPSDSADIVVLPDADSDFSGEYKGNHGGLTAEEMLVPVLYRGFAMPTGTIPTSQVLKSMGLRN
jgi:hypothetical protein